MDFVTMQSREVDGRTVRSWRYALRASAEALQEAQDLLNDEERQRVARLLTEDVRRRATMARAGLRRLLGEVLGIEARELQFAYGKNGKPRLAHGSDFAGWHFNLSHTQDQAVIALAQGAELGIDIEFIDASRRDRLEVARSFHATERDYIRLQSLRERPMTFYRMWTRKEALVKACGASIGEHLDEVVVSGDSGEPRILQLPEAFGKIERWAMFDIGFGSCAGALAVARR